MTSTRTAAARTILPEREGELSLRLMEVRPKIQDEEYLNNAIQRIAQVISKKLVENPEELQIRD